MWSPAYFRCPIGRGARALVFLSTNEKRTHRQSHRHQHHAEKHQCCSDPTRAFVVKASLLKPSSCEDIARHHSCLRKLDLRALGANPMRRWILPILAVVFGGMYVNVGVQHFTDTAWFEPIVPAVLGDPTIWVLITGVMEIAIGVGLILPWTRRHAALGSFVFLIGIYWANFNMWYNNIPLSGKTYAHHWHVLRLVAQLGMMVLSYAIWRSSQATEVE